MYIRANELKKGDYFVKVVESTKKIQHESVAVVGQRINGTNTRKAHKVWLHNVANRNKSYKLKDNQLVIKLTKEEAEYLAR